jgi:HK97 family phage portal protein
MNLLSTMFGWFRGNATAQRQGSQTALPSASAYEESVSVGPDSALQVSTVWACVKLLVETIASLPLFVYSTDSAGRRTLARSETLYQMLHDSPNLRHTMQEFWEYMLLNLVLRGNAYARIERNARGEAYALWPMAADQIEVKAMPDGSLIYAYTLDDKTLIYTEDQILHIRGIGNGIVGMSPLDYMRASVGLAISAQNHTAATFRKQARRPGVLMTDKVLTKDQRNALRESFGEIASGGQRELYILEANFKYEPIGMSPADIQLLETRRFAVEDLARWFGVPSVLINDTSKTTTWGTGVEQIIEGFYKFTLRPQLERIEQAIQRRVLTSSQRARGLHAEFSFDALLRASLKDRMEIYAKATQNGIKTRNECRQLENDPPLPGGDALTAQVNLVPIEMLGKVQSKGGSDASQDPVAQ